MTDNPMMMMAMKEVGCDWQHVVVDVVLIDIFDFFFLVLLCAYVCFYCTRMSVKIRVQLALTIFTAETYVYALLLHAIK